MKNRILKFTVKNQRISSEDVSVVADSRNYLLAWFFFDNTWDSVEKTAVFSQGKNVYNMVLTDDMCRIPAEVITGDGFFVSVFGGNLITADKIKISVTPSGLAEGAAPPEPTQSVYDQLLTLVASERAAASTFADESGESAKNAALSAQAANTSAQQAHEYCESVEVNQKIVEEYIAKAEEERAQYEQTVDVRLDGLEQKTSDVVKTTDLAETHMELYNGDKLLASRKATLDAMMMLEISLSSLIDGNTNQISELEGKVAATEGTVSIVPHIYEDYLSKSRDLDYDVYRAIDGRLSAPTTSAVLKAINDVKAENKFRVISSGTLDDTTAGVAQIKAALTEEIYNMTEFKLYLEVPVGLPTDTTTSIYINAHIDGSAALKNCILATTRSAAPAAGDILRTISQINITSAPDGNRYVQSVANQLASAYGINTRTNPLATLCPWTISETATTRYLYLNISNYNFESGTKWVLEGR